MEHGTEVSCAWSMVNIGVSYSIDHTSHVGWMDTSASGDMVGEPRYAAGFHGCMVHGARLLSLLLLDLCCVAALQMRWTPCHA